ncbi:hypothetical protein BV25DRAFT_1824918 [Artomyces pyxidatus]|uniref:Uncharacterized protein n=1 Tax=Artomyces pyxidatus TaxID=48021 RepID=A0ACB8T415_9AGAM|nr:hypothetical protein BV25DRAFT_1824918 [Artomyces pyxidatus]
MSSRRCNFCRERSNEKRCMGCRQARYCSSHCQVADWTTHKSCCVPTYVIDSSVAMRSERKAVNYALSKWIARWRKTIHKYAENAFDVSNNSSSILQTHVVTIRMEGKMSHKDDTDRFLIQRGLLLPVDGIAELLWGLEAPNELITRLQNDLDANRKVDDVATSTGRVVIQYEELLLRLLRFPLRQEGLEKSVSAAHASSWEADLINTIDART